MIRGPAINKTHALSSHSQRKPNCKLPSRLTEHLAAQDTEPAQIEKGGWWSLKLRNVRLWVILFPSKILRVLLNKEDPLWLNKTKQPQKKICNESHHWGLKMLPLNSGFRLVCCSPEARPNMINHKYSFPFTIQHILNSSCDFLNWEVLPICRGKAALLAPGKSVRL